MKVPFLCFNIILAALLLAAAGCKSSGEKKKGKEAAFLRFHLETNPTGTGHNAQVQVYRAQPISVTIERDAVLDEAFMSKAELATVDQFGNYGIKIQFDEEGTRRLDYLTSANKGKRLAVNCGWTETRFLAAPLITKRITDGVFIFTPDATREETERIIAGLNNVIKKLKKPYTF